MSQEQYSAASTILLMEADPSMRRVIALGLQHQGMHVIETTSLTAISPADMDAIDVLVLDVDGGVTSNWSLLAAIQAHARLSMLPVVVLAWKCQPAQSVPLAATATLQTQTTYLAKPFDARALHTMIEQLLKSKAAQKAALEAQAEAALLASYARQTPASIWPVVTAAGLLLAVIGLLFQVAVVAACGVLVVLVALLLWTLGTGAGRTASKAEPVAVGA
jgi:DNA-binding NtrC family response regulator